MKAAIIFNSMKGRKVFSLLIILITGCALVSLKDLSYFTVYPDCDYGVLSEDEEISIVFTESVDPVSVESILALESQKGRVDFYPRWKDGQEILIQPLSHMEAGLQYRLIFQGVYKNREGDEREADLSRPFYYIDTLFEPLQLIGTLPAYGESLAPSGEMQLLFNAAVDENTLTRGLTLSPSADYDAHSLGNSVFISPSDMGWDNLSSYTISLSNELKSLSGKVLFPEEDFFFSVEEEPENPSVIRIGSCSRSRLEDFTWTGTSLDLLKTDEGIRISFSKSMDHNETESALSFSPSLSGEHYWLENDLVFCPGINFYSGQVYRLSLSTEAKSIGCIPLDREYSLDFSPDIEPLEVLSIKCSSGEGLTLSEFSEDSPCDLPLSEISPYELCFHISFSRPFESDIEKQSLQDLISFHELFSSGGGITAELYSWTSDYRLTILYSGFSTEDEHYYILEIPGGEYGAVNAAGSRMEEDLTQLFRTVPE